MKVYKDAMQTKKNTHYRTIIAGTVVILSVFTITALANSVLPNVLQTLGVHASDEPKSYGVSFTGIPVPPSGQDIPECTEHDSNQWHALYDPDKNCHYDHEHKANPHDVDDIFGTKVYDWAGGNTISYPWQTGETGTEENERKHESYGYIVHRDLDPMLSRSTDQNTKKDLAYIRDLRVQGHFDLNHVGIKSRFHSDYIEMRVCYRANKDDCGIVRLGGHQDYDELYVDGKLILLGQESTTDVKKLAADVNERQHRSSENRDGTSRVKWTGRFRTGENSEHGVTPLSYGGFIHSTEDSSTLADPNDIDKLIFASNPKNNNSTHKLESLITNFRTQYAKEGRINWSGWSNRQGGLGSPDCKTPSPDCVPMSFENVPGMEKLQLEMSRNRAPNPYFEYDTAPNGQQWIQYHSHTH